MPNIQVLYLSITCPLSIYPFRFTWECEHDVASHRAAADCTGRIRMMWRAVGQLLTARFTWEYEHAMWRAVW
jgi:hypothetical protein